MSAREGGGAEPGTSPHHRADIAIAAADPAAARPWRARGVQLEGAARAAGDEDTAQLEFALQERDGQIAYHLESHLRRVLDRLAAAERRAEDADALQGEVDALTAWQRRVCDRLTPEGDDGPLVADLVEARLDDLLAVERFDPRAAGDWMRGYRAGHAATAAWYRSRAPRPASAEVAASAVASVAEVAQAIARLCEPDNPDPGWGPYADLLLPLREALAVAERRAEAAEAARARAERDTARLEWLATWVVQAGERPGLVCQLSVLGGQSFRDAIDAARGATRGPGSASATPGGRTP